MVLFVLFFMRNMSMYPLTPIRKVISTTHLSPYLSHCVRPHKIITFVYTHVCVVYMRYDVQKHYHFEY